MSLSRFVLNLVAGSLQKRQRPELHPENPRILIIRRNRMGDMICALPLLHALRRKFPTAHLTVACDPPGAPIAQTCGAVNEVVVLKTGWNRWVAAFQNAAQLQGYDWVIAAKGGFDRRLATLGRLTNAARRIGFESGTNQDSAYYTDPVPLSRDPNTEHQIETMLRLLQPLGLSESAIDLTLSLPKSAREFAVALFTQPPFIAWSRLMLINISSTTPLKFRPDDLIPLAQRILQATDLAIGFVAAPSDQSKARELTAGIASNRVAAIATPGPLELAALLERAAFLLTPEGGAAHLAAAVNAPALVLWSEGPFRKWHSRGANHTFIRLEPGEETIPLERVWQALKLYLKTL
jgi:ADP-heptose:LPS heptosyltransferase